MLGLPIWAKFLVAFYIAWTCVITTVIGLDEKVSYGFKVSQVMFIMLSGIVGFVFGLVLLVRYVL